MSPFTSSKIDQGYIYSGAGATVHIPDDPLFAPLVPELDAFTGKANAALSIIKDEAQPAHMQRLVEPLVAMVNKVRVAATNTAREYESAKVRVLTPDAQLAEAARFVGPEVRGQVRGQGPGEQVAFALRATPLELAALLEADGALSGLHDQAMEIVREKAAIAFHISRTALAGRYPNAPSEQKIIAIGTDDAATYAAAEIALASFKARGKAIEAAEGVLQRLVAYIAAATAVSPSVALQRVLAA
jgi:hypothetical protein